MDTPMNKTELALAAIFRHCDEVAEGKRPPRTEQEGKGDARTFLGVKLNAATHAPGANEKPLK